MTMLVLGLATFGLGVTGLSAASAAALGGLASSDLGADNGGVASCDTDGVAVAYTVAYDSPSGGYVVGAVTVGGLAPTCSGSTVNVTLADASGGSVSSGSALIGGTPPRVTVVPAADATRIMHAAVVVTG